jgi:hypothetical protein
LAWESAVAAHPAAQAQPASAEGAAAAAPVTVPLPPDRPASVPSINTPPEKPPVENSYLDGPLLYQLLLAEFNRSEGQSADAIELMLEAARRNKDDTLFRRALEIAVEAGRPTRRPRSRRPGARRCRSRRRPCARRCSCCSRWIA